MIAALVLGIVIGFGLVVGGEVIAMLAERRRQR